MEEESLAPLKVNKIPGVGEHTYQALQAMGVQTIRDLSEQPAADLERRFGKYGLDLWNKARGIHEGQVVNYHEAKSISTEITFEENNSDLDSLMAEMVRMTEREAYELRHDNNTAQCLAGVLCFPAFASPSQQA